MCRHKAASSATRVMLQCHARGRFIFVKLTGRYRCARLEEIKVYTGTSGGEEAAATAAPRTCAAICTSCPTV